MTRMKKKAERRAICPRKLKCVFAEKSGPKKDNLEQGYRIHENGVQVKNVFIPKVKNV